MAKKKRSVKNSSIKNKDVKNFLKGIVNTCALTDEEVTHARQVLELEAVLAKSKKVIDDFEILNTCLSRLTKSKSYVQFINGAPPVNRNIRIYGDIIRPMLRPEFSENPNLIFSDNEYFQKLISGEADYDEATGLGVVRMNANKNGVTNYESVISFDEKVLKKENLEIEDPKYRVIAGAIVTLALVAVSASRQQFGAMRNYIDSENVSIMFSQNLNDEPDYRLPSRDLNTLAYFTNKLASKEDIEDIKNTKLMVTKVRLVANRVFNDHQYLHDFMLELSAFCNQALYLLRKYESAVLKAYPKFLEESKPYE